MGLVLRETNNHHGRRCTSGKANDIGARGFAKARNAILLNLVDAVVGSIPHTITRVPVSNQQLVNHKISSNSHHKSNMVNTLAVIAIAFTAKEDGVASLALRVGVFPRNTQMSAFCQKIKIQLFHTCSPEYSPKRSTWRMSRAIPPRRDHGQ